MLSIQGLKARVEGKEVLKGLDLNIPKGEIHVIMGPNGIGKSTLGHVLMGSQVYTVDEGKVYLEGEDLTSLDTAGRAQKGLFLAFQYPVSIPGLKISEYLRNLYNLRHNLQIGVAEFRKLLKDKFEVLGIERASLQRFLNEGFSGGETKRFEMLQMMLLEPKLAILDEIDSGVDIDGQKRIADVIRSMSQTGTSFLIVTHYQRMLSLIKPHKVHVLLEGKISRSGDLSLVEALEREGYHLVAEPNNFVEGV
jgi:Fe-S cluster assembly ATP-binding protein